MISGSALVTGGAGFIGRRLVRRLLELGREVTVLDALVEEVHGPAAEPPAELAQASFIRGDVREPSAWRAALEGAELIYYLAAETGTGESMYRALRYVDVNVGDTVLLCDLIGAGAAQPRRVVLASSRAVYGEVPYRCSARGRGPAPGRLHPPRSLLGPHHWAAKSCLGGGQAGQPRPQDAVSSRARVFRPHAREGRFRPLDDPARPRRSHTGT